MFTVVRQCYSPNALICAASFIHSGVRIIVFSAALHLASAFAATPPAIAPGGIVNSAGYAAGAGIARGSLFTIFGTGIGPAAGVTGTLPYGTQLPQGTGSSITVNSAGNTLHAFITYASASQVNAILPSNAPLGPATITVSFNGLTSSSENINIVQSAFQVLAENAQGWGQAAAQLYPGFLNNNLVNPASPAQTMVLYGTGLGPLPSGMSDGAPLPSAAPPLNFLQTPYNYSVSVRLNGQTVPASFAGRSSQYPGLDQINFTLPSTIATGCFVRGEVVVQSGAISTVSNPFTIAVAAPGQSCPNVFGLNGETLRSLQSGGAAKIGLVWLTKVDTIGPGGSIQPAGSGQAFFASVNKPALFGLNSLLTASALRSGAVADPSVLPPAGACTVIDGQAYVQLPAGQSAKFVPALAGNIDTPTFQSIFPGAVFAPIPAGPAITVEAPDGSAVPLTPSDTAAVGAYAAPLSPLFFGGGTLTASASGSDGGLGPFSLSLTVPPPLQWTNAPQSLLFPLDTDMIFQWPSGSGGQVTITGAALDQAGSGEVLICSPDASAGQFTAPAAELQLLSPVASDSSLSALAITGSAPAPLTAAGLDAAVAIVSTGARIDASRPLSIFTSVTGSQSAAVNTAFASPLVTVVLDSSGNPVPGIVVTYTAPTSGPSGAFNLGVHYAITDQNGTAVPPAFVANGIPGSYTVTATAPGASAPAVFSLTNVSVPQISIAAAAGTPQSAAVNSAFSQPLSAVVKDIKGNPLSGIVVTFTAPSSGPGGAFAGGVATATTNAAGLATSPVFTANGTSGTYEVTATVDGANAPAVFMLTNSPVTAASLTVASGSQQSVTVNTAFAAPLVAVAKDAKGNPAAGVVVTFAAPAAGPSVAFQGGVNMAVTNSQGIAVSALLTANAVAGSYSVTATIPGPAAPAAFALTNLPGPAALIQATRGTPQSAKIGTTFAAPLTATVTDSAGNPVSGVVVTFNAPASGPSGSFQGAASVATDANGAATSPAFAANSVAGAYAVTASASGISTTAVFSLSNTAAAAVSITMLSGSGQSTAISTPFAAPFVVSVADAGGNPVSGVVVTFSPPASGPGGSFPSGAASGVSNAQGIVTSAIFTTNSKAGKYQVIAALPGTTATTAFSLTNTPGPPAAISAAGGSGQAATVNSAFQQRLQALVTDSGGNPVTGVTVVFTAPPQTGPSTVFSGGTNVSTSVTNAQGLATSAPMAANAYAGVVYTVVASFGTTATASFALSNLAGPAARIAPLSGSGQTAAVNSSFASPLVAIVTDAVGNAVPGVAVTFSAPASGASAAFAGNRNTAITNSQGAASSPALTANSVAGVYNVLASVPGVAGAASFSLTNQTGGGSGGGSGTISVTDATIGQNLEAGITVTLTPAPPQSGVLVTITSANPALALVGGKSVFTATITPGLNPFSIPVQSLAASGTTTVSFSAPGYSSASANITAAPSGFVIAGPNDIGGAFSVSQGSTTQLTVFSGRLDASGAFVERQPVRRGLSVDVPLTMSNAALGQLTPATASFGDETDNAAVSFVASSSATGVTSITAGVPSGFSSPANGSAVTVTVQQTSITPFTATVGQNLEKDVNITLGAATPVSDSVVLTSTDPSRLLFSNSAAAAGSASITVNIAAKNAISATFFVQALASSGTVTYTAASAHYGTVTGTVTLAPGGLAIQSPGGFAATSFDAPLTAGPESLQIFTGALDSSGAFLEPQLVAGGGSITVAVTSGNVLVGTISTSPISIAGGSGEADTTFQPASPGTAVVTASGAGLTAARVNATVVNQIPPLLFTSGDLVIGQYLASPYVITLPAVAGAGGVQVTVSVDSASVALSATATGAGSSTLKLSIPPGSNSASFYVQGLANSGTANISASAAGFASTSGTIALATTGFALYPPAINGAAGQNLPSGLTVYAAWLDSTGAPQASSEVLFGSSAVPVSLTSDTPSVASVPATVTVAPGAASASVPVSLKAQGSAIISVTQPAGFATPTSLTTASVSVN